MEQEFIVGSPIFLGCSLVFMCGGQAGSPGKKPGNLLTRSLEICRG